MIKAVNVSKIYQQGKTRIGAVKNVCLEIARDESVFITGPSGAGKSTLLHLLGGLDKPTGGKIFFDGKNFYNLPDNSRSKIRNEKIGFVFQFYHLLSDFTVLENVMLPALMGRGKPRRSVKNIRKDARNLLKLVGLEMRAKHTPRELSGGESQRAAIARALVNFPEILMCDEPTGNLDSKTSEEIINCLWMLKEKKDMAIVMVTHDEDMREREDFDKKFRITDGIIEVLNYGTQGLPEWQVCK